MTQILEVVSIILDLELVLARLEEYGLQLKLNKCKFMQKTVTYIGYTLSAEGISPTEEKAEAIKAAPRPENATQVLAFLGLINYHGKFTQNLSTIVHPLNQLLQKGQEFKWSTECEKAFCLTKESLTSSRLLVHFNPDLPNVLECDASQYGLGAVISHHFPNGVEKPIAYASRSLSPAEKNYSQIKKEGLAIVFGITKCYMYLYGKKFTLHTDHKPSLKIFSPDGATPVLAASHLQRWAILLSLYQMNDIKYKSSKDIDNADFRQDASVVACVQMSPISLLHAEKGHLRNCVPNRVPAPCCFSRIRGLCSDWLLDRRHCLESTRIGYHPKYLR